MLSIFETGLLANQSIKGTTGRGLFGGGESGIRDKLVINRPKRG